MAVSGRTYERAATAVPIVIDLAHLLAFDLLNRPLRRMLGGTSVLAGVVLLALYLAWAVSLYFVGRLHPDLALTTLTLRTRDDLGRERATKTTWPQFLFFYPGFGFGIVMIMAVVTATGMTSEASALSERAQQLMVGGALAVFFVQVGGMVSDITPRYKPSQPGYLATLVPVALVSEVMLNLSVALWHRFLGLDASGPAPAAPSVAGFLVAAPLFLLFFAIPRFTLLSRSFTWPSLASGLALALFELWQILDEAPLL